MLNLIEDATLNIGYANGTGLGAVLLALVVISVCHSPWAKTGNIKTILKALLSKKTPKV